MILINEALTVSRVSTFGGPNKPFPDGSSDGDMIGHNSVISVEVAHSTGWSNKGDYITEAYFDGDNNPTIIKIFKNGKDAINLGNKLLKEVTNKSADPKDVAKKYGMEYFEG